MDISIDAALNNLSMAADNFLCDRETRIILELSKKKIKALIDEKNKLTDEEVKNAESK